MSEHIDRLVRERGAGNDTYPETRARIERLGCVIINALSNATVAGKPGFRNISPASLGRLTRRFTNKVERALLFDSALEAMDAEEQQEAVKRLWAQYSPNMPIPSLYDYASEASIWASFSSHQELMAYMAAIWHRLSRQLQDGFLRKIGAWRTGRRE